MIATSDRNTRHTSITPLPTRRRQMARAVGAAGRLRLETLEPRTLLSATWQNSFTNALTGAAVNVWDMVADSAGNVYEVGPGSTSGGLREKASGSSTWTPLSTTGVSYANSVAVDSAGKLYVASAGLIYARDAAQGTFSVVAGSVAVAGNCNSLTIDATGALWATFNGGLQKGVVDASDQMQLTTLVPAAGVNFVDVTVTASGIFAAGTGTSNQWSVRKSMDGGATWASVDSFALSATQRSVVTSITHDSAGNLYAAGEAYDDKVITGYTKVKGVQKPVYGTFGYMVARRSTDGGATWQTDLKQTFAGNQMVTEASDVAVDASGVVYVVGDANDVGPRSGIVLRRAVDGTWATVDNYAMNGNPTFYNTVTVDPITGTPYVGGYSEVFNYPAPNVYTQLIRSGPAPAPAPLAAQSLTAAPSITHASSTAPAGGSATPSLVQLPSTTPAGAPIATPAITTTSAITQETPINASLTDPRLKALRPILN